MTAYYNEIDQFAAQWLRNLIQAGHIAPGIVDERSIEDVRPNDLKGFAQCHFFAGVGVWSHALRNAGWADDRPVWTGSCPCQPFSSAGAGSGFDDQRHLWPHFQWLIQECKPPIVIGEQVASKDANPWIDLVQTDLEALGYGVGAVAFPSASVGAPHIRDRLYWVANTGITRSKAGLPTEKGGHQRVTGISDHSSGQCAGPEWRPTDFGLSASGGLANVHSDGCDQAGQCVAATWCNGVVGDCTIGWVGDADSERTGRDCASVCGSLDRKDGQHGTDHADAPGANGGMADAEHDGCGGQGSNKAEQNSDGQDFGLSNRGHIALEGQPATGPTNGFWADADWLLCRDGKWRPVEPGTFPLVNGASARVGRLRAYGNAINAQAAQVFIECVMESVA